MCDGCRFCLNSRYAVMNIYRLDQLSGNISSPGPDEASAIRDSVNGAINDSGKIIRRPQQHREDRGGGGADRYTRGRCEHSGVCGARFRRRADCASSAAASGSTHHCARAAPAPTTTGGHRAGRLVGLQPRLLGLRPRRIWLRSGPFSRADCSFSKFPTVLPDPHGLFTGRRHNQPSFHDGGGIDLFDAHQDLTLFLAGDGRPGFA
jgi:hypothetical protein